MKDGKYLPNLSSITWLIIICATVKFAFQLFGIGLQPLECRFCHHTRRGLGRQCHSDIEKDWYSEKGQKLIIRWNEITRVFERYDLMLNVEKLRKSLGECSD
jgi:hypothetical protein